MSEGKCSLKMLFVTLLVAVLCVACGYGFKAQSGFPGDSDLIFVKVLENQTQETGIENIVTAALLSELTLRKTAGLASGMDDADVILSGVVEEVAIRTISTRSKDTAGERRVTVSVDLNLKKQDGSVLWKARGLTEDEGYIVAADTERTDLNRRLAIQVLSQRIAERAVNRLSDDF